MRAVIYERYGPPDVLEVRELPDPVPGAHELLIRVRTATVTSGDCRVRSLRVPTGFGLPMRLVFGVRKPRRAILGTEAAGTIEAVGGSVAKFRTGDDVVVSTGFRMGCHAEFVTMPEDGAVILKPAALSWEEAAALPFGGLAALSFLRRAGLRRGQRILVNGASGAVGSAAVQLAAREFGADVTGVCSAGNRDLVLSLGAAGVIDHAREDFTRSGAAYDVIVDAVGNAPYSRSRNALRPDGRLLLAAAGVPDMLPIPWVSLTTRRRIIAGTSAERAEDLAVLAGFAHRGSFRPVIDRRYPLDETAEAHRYVETGHKRGSVVIAVSAC